MIKTFTCFKIKIVMINFILTKEINFTKLRHLLYFINNEIRNSIN